MTKIDVFSGFLGAGKTTLIKKMIQEAFAGQKIVLIENEFGEIAVDGDFLADAGVQINEMSSGCICCSLVGDFRVALKQVIDDYAPERILIEPSGVGKLSDITRAVEGVVGELDVCLNSFVTVADVSKVKLYMNNFGEFYNDQIEHASCIMLSRTANVSEEKIAAAVAKIKEKNPNAHIVTTPWEQLEGAQILAAMQEENDFTQELLALAEQANAHDHHEHEHHHEHGEGCTCGCHDHDHHEHHHEHGEGCTCGCHDHDHHEHEHHHEHGESCTCGCHDHDHHHADEVFTSWGTKTAHKTTKEALEEALHALDSGDYGMILRAKGIVDGGDSWYEFDYVPGECNIRARKADITGKIVVIGAHMDEAKVSALFGC